MVKAAVASVGSDVIFVNVLHHHAMHVEFRTKSRDGTLHTAEPASGQSVGAAVIERGNYRFQEPHIGPRLRPGPDRQGRYTLRRFRSTSPLQRHARARVARLRPTNRRGY